MTTPSPAPAGADRDWPDPVEILAADGRSPVVLPIATPNAAQSWAKRLAPVLAEVRV